MKKTLIVVTSNAKLGNTGKPTGYFLAEVTHPYYKLHEAGLQVDFASPQGGKAPMSEHSRNISDPYNKRFLDNADLMKQIENTISLTDINALDYAAIIFAGGHGTMWDFPENKVLQKMAAQIYESGGIIAAVCHGPTALVNVTLNNGTYLVSGKTVTAFSNEEEASIEATSIMPFLLETVLQDRGATFTKADLWQPHVVVSERLVTGQNPASALGMGEAVVKLLLQK